jgi:hypothetical protein
MNCVLPRQNVTRACEPDENEEQKRGKHGFPNRRVLPGTPVGSIVREELQGNSGIGAFAKHYLN